MVSNSNNSEIDRRREMNDHKLLLVCLMILFSADFTAAENPTLPAVNLILLGGSTSPPVVGTVTSAGQVWMDRNLGASRVATSSTDSEAYGDLYQWGRGSDGHEKRDSATTATLSSSDTPGHGDFITVDSGLNDWRTPQNDNLWQGVSGTNNPCPAGFRLPTETELNTERVSWSSNDSAGAYGSPLKLVVAGYRLNYNGTIYYAGSYGYYWSSTVNGSYSRDLSFGSGDAGMYNVNRGYGFSVRCLKDEPPACDSTHLNLCSTESACTGVGGFWWSDNTCNSTEEPPACDSTHLNLCSTESACTGAGGYWWSDNTCNSTPESTAGTVTSAGQVWLDRNLGASRVATSSTDSEAYGDLYQWGRGSDGHEKRDSTNTSTLSSSDTPGHGVFITADSSSLYDWRTPQNDNLWQGVSGVNNPCPAGFRLPTTPELNTERISWSSNNSAGAYGSPLKLVTAGSRDLFSGQIFDIESEGTYWSSTVDEGAIGRLSGSLGFDSGYAGAGNTAYRANGHSIRCIKD